MSGVFNSFELALETIDEMVEMGTLKRDIGTFIQNLFSNAYQKQNELQRKQGWISVEDKPPEIGEEVYTCSTKIKGWEPRSAQYIGEGMFRDFHCTYYVAHNEVTHWQPLPEPPKE